MNTVKILKLFPMTSTFLLLLFEIFFSLEAVMLPFILAQSMNATIKNNWIALSVYFVLTLVLTFGFVIAKFFQIKIAENYFLSVQMSLKKQTFAHFISQNPSSVLRRGSSTYLNLFLKDIEIMTNAIRNVFSFVRSALQFLGIFIIFSIFNFFLSLTIFGLTFLFYLLSLFLNKMNARFGLTFSNINRNYLSKVHNLLQGYVTFLQANKLKNMHRELQTINISSFKLERKENFKYFFLNSFFEFFLNSLTIFSLLISGIFIFFNLVEITVVVLSLWYIGRIQSIFYSISFNVKNMMLAEQLFSSILHISCINNKTKSDILPSFSSITINKIDLFYENENNKIQIFNKFSLNIIKGKKYAIIGENGTGKSSLALIILGILSPTYGEVFWNNKNYNSIHPSSLLNNFHYVASDFQIFDATVKENITFFNKQQFLDSELRSVLDKLSLHHIKLNDLVNTQKISLGEAQRLSLSRVFLVPKPIVILDEAFSNVDFTNKERIEKLFLKNHDLTFINITHHLDNPDLYDFVINLSNNKGEN